MPAGWGVGTALHPGERWSPTRCRRRAARRSFAATNVEQLEDSPVIAGQYFHEFPLAPDDHAEALYRCGGGLAGGREPAPGGAGRDEQPGARGRCAVRLAPLQRLPLSADAFRRGGRRGPGARPVVGQRRGREGITRTTRTSWPKSDLLSHEFTHSWNGKYRRPVGSISRTSPRRSRARCCGSTRA